MQYTNETQSRRLFAPLYLLGMVGVLAYALFIANALPTIAATLIEDAPPLPPLPVLVLGVMLNYGVMLAVAVFIGLWATRRLNFSPAPILSGQADDAPRRLAVGLGSGVAVGLVTLGVYALVIRPLNAIPMSIATDAPPLLALLNAFLYGGITEELLMRLGLMTVILWIAGRINGGNVNPTAFWTVNLIVWVLFGLGHLPSAVTLLGLSITPMLVLIVVTLNAVSLLFGWLYWHRGIETAMAAHMGFHVGYTLVGLFLL
jgi:hypothetical protein